MGPALRGSQLRGEHQPSRELNIQETVQWFTPRLKSRAGQIPMPALQPTDYVTLANCLTSLKPFHFPRMKNANGENNTFKTFQRTNYTNTSKALEQYPVFTGHSINIVKRMNGDARLSTAREAVYCTTLEATCPEMWMELFWAVPCTGPEYRHVYLTVVHNSKNWKFKCIYL